MIHGRFRNLGAFGAPGDPGGSNTPPGGGGGPPGPGGPNPPDDGNGGPDDPGGYGGPVGNPGAGTGVERCSLIHTISIQNLPADLPLSMLRFQGVWVATFNGAEWLAEVFTSGGEHQWITLEKTDVFNVNLVIDALGAQVVCIFSASIDTVCPGQSLYPITAPTDRGFGDFAGSRCLVG